MSIDANAQRVTRVERMKSGKVKQYELRFSEVKQVVLNNEEAGHGVYLFLEKHDGKDNLSIDNQSFIHGESLFELSKKLGTLLKKPVISRYTEGGKFLSEEKIQD